MRSDKSQAIALRKQGKTYGQISGILKIPKGTLSGWLKTEEWSREITREWEAKNGKERIQTLNKARHEAFVARHGNALREAESVFSEAVDDPLFIAGLCLYWGEGDKRTRHQVRITNTDPGIIRSFLRFLRKYATPEESRIWVSLIKYDDLVASECEQYWERETGLPREHFQKTVSIRGKGTVRRSPYGVCVLGVSDSLLKTKIMFWIAQLEKRL